MQHARNLHRAAQQVVAEHNGQLPNDRATLLKLPGIGKYAGCPQHRFRQIEPLDGNVKHVLSRLADIDQPINETATLKLLWQLARALVGSRAGRVCWRLQRGFDGTGGAGLCPSRPRCLLCPLVDLCGAFANGTQALRPVMPLRKATPHYDVAAGVIWQGKPFASQLLQNPSNAPRKGYWVGCGNSPAANWSQQMRICPLALTAREIDEELVIQIEVGELVTIVQHAYTHFRITLHAFHARYTGGEPQTIGCADWRWVELADLDVFPFPVTDQKIA